MRGVRFTKAELGFLKTALGPMVSSKAELKLCNSIERKLAAAQEPEAKGANVRELEDALVASAGLKVARLITGHARASRQAANLGVTSGDMGVVGAWMDRQGWLHGPQTLIDVLNKWSQWLPKALATEPPPSLSPGLGGTGERDRSRSGDLRQGATAPGPGPARRRPAAGLR